ncbi:MAG: TatD family hydrolase [Bacilli bacterium]|nr:TatD family hydrolase [Bacilli bacterium]
MLVDTHCHLNDEQLLNNIDLYIENAKKNDVTTLFVASWDLASSKIAIELAHKHDNIYAIIGFHPCNIDDMTEANMEQFFELLKDDKVIALGEIGLDYHWVTDESQRLNQRKMFIKQIEIANQYDLPISIHSRDALQDTLDILKEHPLKKGGVMHCYSGSVEMMNEFIKTGMYISFAGPLTFKNAKASKECAVHVPLDKFFVETDCPYLTPHPHRGELNEPMYVNLVAIEMAYQKQIDVDEIKRISTENVKRLFNI